MISHLISPKNEKKTICGKQIFGVGPKSFYIMKTKTEFLAERTPCKKCLEGMNK